jgi:hypothetical protein
MLRNRFDLSFNISVRIILNYTMGCSRVVFYDLACLVACKSTLKLGDKRGSEL